MSKFSDINNRTIGSTDQLQAIVLECMILAAELDHEPLLTWATQESGGYRSVEDVPNYRKFRGTLGGTWQEEFLLPISDDVPKQILGNELAEIIETSLLMDSIGILNTKIDDGTLRLGVNKEQELLAFINSNFTNGRFHTLWVCVPPGTIQTIKISVQHKVIDFMIELERLYPTLKEIEEKSTESSRVLSNDLTSSVQFNGINHVVMAENIYQTDLSNHSYQRINVGDWESLESYLKRQNVSPQDLATLKPILEKIEQGDESEEVKVSLRDWVDNSAETIAAGAGEMAKDVTKQTVTEVIVDGIKKYVPDVVRFGLFITPIIVRSILGE